MRKLEIIYKTGRELHAEETEMRITLNDIKTELQIGTKETKKLKYLVNWITEELKRRRLIETTEELEISQFDKFILEFEETQEKRVDNAVYNLCKRGYKAVEEGKETWEHFLNLLQESRCKECI